MKVSVSAVINCAHKLPGTEMHGHTYQITATFRRDTLEHGMLVPFQTLRDALLNVTRRLDHWRLEPVIGEPATAERLALFVRDNIGLPNISVRVEVGEDGAVETE